MAIAIPERPRRFVRRAVSCGMIIVLTAGLATGGPRGPSVSRGSASVTQNGSQTIIQAGNNAIINWQSFSIASNEAVRFIQPSSSSRVMNRVVGGQASTIMGLLQANGQVYIINPAGVFFGNTAVVNVGALYAAAGHMSDQDFLNNVNHFTGLSGSVVNYGSISGNGVYLAGQQVANYGSIVCPQGLVVMAAGNDVYISEQNGTTMVKVTGGQSDAAKPGVQNAGTVEADNGGVIFGAGDMYSLAIQNSGTVKAKDIQVQAAAGKVEVSGTLDASDNTPGATGGKVEVTGDAIALNSAKIDASGNAGGGTVLIGGDYQGKNPDVRNAQSTAVSADSTIRADALSAGDGGRVIVWSDTATTMGGSISARGGPVSGNGGFVEISSGQSLSVAGSAVNTTAPHGAAGTLLLDPKNIVINDTGGDPIAGNQLYSDNPAGAVTFTPTDLTNWLVTNGTLTLQANTDILIESATVNLSGAPSGSTLTLNAGRHIIFAQTPDTVTPSSSTGAVAVTLNNGSLTLRYNDDASDPANRDAGTGVLLMAAGSSINTGGGAITVTQGTLTPNTGGVTLGGLTTAGGSLQVTSAGPLTIGAISTAGADNGSGGSITLIGGADLPVSLGTITTVGGADVTASGGHAGGAFTLFGGSVTLSTVNTSGSNAATGSGGGGGNAGAINIDLNLTATFNGAVTARGGTGDGGGSSGADASLTVQAATVNLSAPFNVGGISGLGVNTVNVHAGGRINNGIALVTFGGNINLDDGVTYPEDVLVSTALTLTSAGTVLAHSWGSTAGVTTTLRGGFTTTAGGTSSGFDFAGPVILSAATSLNSSATAGAILFEQTLDGTASRSQTLTLTAGAGGIAFVGPVGATAPLGAVTFNAANTISAQNTFSAASVVQATASTGGTTFQSINTSFAGLAGGNVTLWATGALAVSGTIEAGGGADTALTGGLAGGRVDLSGGTTVSVSSIDTSGSAAGAGSALGGGAGGVITINIGRATGNTGQITLLGPLTATGGAGDGGAASGAGANISLGNPVTLGAGIAVNASGSTAGIITFYSTIDGFQPLSLTAVGTGGAVLLAGAVGQTVGLADLSIAAPKLDLYAAVLSVPAPTGAGVTTINVHPGAFINQALDFASASAPFSTINIDGGATYSEAVLVSTPVTLNVSAASGTATALSWATATGVPVTLNGSFATLAGGANTNFDLAGPITLSGDTSLSSANGLIHFGSTLDATAVRGQALTLTAGTGAITFDTAVGASVPLGLVVINAASSVLASGPFTAAGVNQTVASTGDTTFQTINTTLAGAAGGNVTLAAGGTLTIGAIAAQGGADTAAHGGYAGGTVNLIGNAVAVNGAINVNGSDAAAASSLAGGNAGSILIDGGNITLASVSPPLNLTATGGAGNNGAARGLGGVIQLAGPVTLASDVAIDTSGSQAGAIAFGRTISGAYNLSLTALGPGSELSFQAAVGSPIPLASLTINVPTVNLSAPIDTVVPPIGINVTTVNVHDGAQINQGMALVAANGAINLDGGAVYAEDVLVAKPLTLNVTTPGTATVFSLTSLAGFTLGLGGSIATTAGGASEQIDLAGPVVLMADASLTTGGNIRLESTVNGLSSGAEGLTLVARGGNVELDAAAGGLAPLARVNFSGGNLLLQNVSTTKDQSYSATGKISLASNYQASSGGIEFNTGQSSPPATASIYSRSGNLTISTGGDFTMHANDKLTALGNLTITAGGTASLGDLTALDNLQVTASQIQVITRPGGSIMNSSGALGTDSGVQLIAGGSLSFSTAPVAVGGFAPPVLASSSGTAANSGVFVVRAISFTEADLIGPGGVVLAAPGELTGAANTDLATALAGLLPAEQPLQEPQVPMESPLTVELEMLGIDLRDPSWQEILGVLTDHALYQDLPRSGGALAWGQPAVDETVLPGQARITTARLNQQGVLRLAKLCLNVLWERSGYEYVSKTPQIRATLEKDAAAYLQATGAAELRGPAFRQYLQLHDPAGPCLSLLNKLQSLFTAFNATGLTPLEIENAKRVILANIAPGNIWPPDLQAAIEGPATPAPSLARH